MKFSIERQAKIAGLLTESEERGPIYEYMEDEVDESVYEMDEMDEMDEVDEMDEMDEADKADEMDEGATFSIDENMLRRELVRLRKLREEADPTESFGGKPEKTIKSYDSVKLNANVSENEKLKKEAKKPAKKDLDEADKDDKKKESVKESRRNRELAARLKESSQNAAKLNKQLEAQKLFNAKLLYVTKLMRDSSLPQNKLKAVVEALDSAKTIREADLLYKSLNEALTRKTDRLAEGTNRTVGNSSRSTRPGGMINESVEVNRWAVLAGIGNDKA